MSSEEDRLAREQKLQRDYEERYVARMSSDDYRGRKHRVEQAKTARRDAKQARRKTG